MKEMTLKANVDNLSKVMEFIDGELERADCNMKSQMQIEVAVEEIFVNIANYAYGDVQGDVVITIDITDSDDGQGQKAVISFADKGIAYDPLKKEDPDVTLSAEERSIGGLGIFLVKKSMDNVSYEYTDGQNILRIEKNL